LRNPLIRFAKIKAQTILNLFHKHSYLQGRCLLQCYACVQVYNIHNILSIVTCTQAIVPKEGVTTHLLRGNHLGRMSSLTLSAGEVSSRFWFSDKH
jgi:hypothetical protein